MLPDELPAKRVLDYGALGRAVQLRPAAVTSNWVLHSDRYIRWDIVQDNPDVPVRLAKMDRLAGPL